MMMMKTKGIGQQQVHGGKAPLLAGNLSEFSFTCQPRGNIWAPKLRRREREM